VNGLERLLQRVTRDLEDRGAASALVGGDLARKAATLVVKRGFQRGSGRRARTANVPPERELSPSRDRDYERIAEVTGQPTEWVAPRGSL
jgi:hypothetical protein